MGAVMGPVEIPMAGDRFEIVVADLHGIGPANFYCVSQAQASGVLMVLRLLNVEAEVTTHVVETAQ